MGALPARESTDSMKDAARAHSRRAPLLCSSSLALLFAVACAGASSPRATADNPSTSGVVDGSGTPPSGCVPSGKARNPIVSHIFTADPSAKVFGDRVYVYTSHDADGQTDFDMIDYHAFSSDDMVNWRDHGVIISTADVPWVTNLYAPDACEKNGKYYLYMPSSGSSIGVAVADDPGGPFVDPLGRPLVTGSTPGAEDVEWVFDPACFVDRDGQGYLYFGGGPRGSGDNARVIRLGADMITLADSAATRILAPAFFEASYVHERGGTYYFSYSTTFEGHAAYLDYMTSNDPLTGFLYRGTFLTNGNVNSNNNNHGSIVELGGKSYLFYHNRKLEQDGGGNNSYQRSVAVQELKYDESGAILPLTMSTQATTVDQLKCLNGLAQVEAETIAAQHGIEVQGNGRVGVSVTAIDDGDWITYSQLDFGTRASTFTARVAAASSGGTIEVRIGSCEAPTSDASSVIGTCAVPSTGGAQAWGDVSCPVTPTSGAHDLCLRFTGRATFAFDHFHFE